MRSLLPKHGKVQALFLTTLKDQRGATMVEYLLMATLVAVTAFFAVQLLGTDLSAKYVSFTKYFK